MWASKGNSNREGTKRVGQVVVRYYGTEKTQILVVTAGDILFLQSVIDELAGFSQRKSRNAELVVPHWFWI